MILEEIKEYAEWCLEDKVVSEDEKYISGKKHKWACQRLLKDIARAQKEDCEFYWDEEEAQRIVNWFALLRHSKGELAGKPINLTKSQKFFICQLYGWRRQDGRKRFKKSFKELARKNAKSQEEAGIALYEISVSASRYREVYEYYTAGTKHDQSKIVLEEAKLMLSGSPLKPKFRITRDRVEHRKTKSFIKALSKDDGKNGDGTNPAGLILDEYHQHKTTEFYDLGLGSSTKESLLMIITTAGMDLTYPCYTQEYELCSRILDPDCDVENDEYLVDIYELDQEDYATNQQLENENAWWKANPIRMSYAKGREKIRGEWKIAKQIPEKMIAFLTKCMNVWVQQQKNQYMNMHKWKLCEVTPDKLPDLQGLPVYIGFDMSAKLDLTSVSPVIPIDTGEKDDIGQPIKNYIVFSHSFIPSRERLIEHVLKDKAPYDAWERDGYITITNSEIVDQGQVLKWALDFVKKYELDLQCLCFDPANAAKAMKDISDAGYTVEEVFQSHKALNECTNGFREQVYCGNVMYLKNPVLNYAMSNAVTRQNNGLIKVDKDATTKRIDPVDSTLCGFKLAMYHDFTESRIEDAIDAFLEGDI